MLPKKPLMSRSSTKAARQPGLDAHLDAWTREVADQRTHGTTGEAPAERFARDEAGALTPLGDVPPFTTARDLVRRVGPVGSRDRPAYRQEPVALDEAPPPTLLRPLSEYEAVAGGGF